MTFAFLIVGLAVGATAAWLVMRSRSAAEVARSRAQADAVRAELEVERRSAEEKFSLVEQANAEADLMYRGAMFDTYVHDE